MAEPHVISALVKKRSQLASDLIQLDKQRNALRLRLAHVDWALQEFGYEGDVADIHPRKTYQRKFARHELRRAIALVMREATTSMTNKDIALLIVERKGWSASDGKLVKAVSASVNEALRKWAVRSAANSPSNSG